MAARVAQRVVDVVALAVAAAGYAAFFWMSRALWQVPPGTDIRPMNMTFNMFLLGIGTSAAILVVSNFAPEPEPAAARRTPVVDLALLASLGVLVLPFVYVPLVAWLRDLHLSG